MKSHLSLFLIPLFLILQACTSQQPETKPSTIGMLQHNVYFYMKEDVTTEEMEAFKEGLVELLSIEEVFAYEIGVPGQTESRDVTDHRFGLSFFSWFETMEDYEVYAVHPVHLAMIEEFSPLWVEVKVYDTEITHSSE